jgi:hypothetical protein
MNLATYTARHAQYTAYLLMKVETKDWHGVADAAMDLRELEALWRGQGHGCAHDGE